MNNDLSNLITCDLGGTKLLVRVCIDEQCIDMKFETGIDFSPHNLSSILKQVEKEYHLHNYPIAVAFPGLLDGKRCLLSNVLPKFNDFDLSNLSDNGRLLLALNDVEAGTHGIIQQERGVEILIMAGTGIGMGIAIDGQVFRGQNGFSGELGSCQSYIDNSLTRLTDVASGKGLRSNRDLDLKQAGENLGMAVSWVINCFNPGRIVFAGGLFNESEYQQACFTAAKKMTLGPSYESCRLELEPEMHSIVVRGLVSAISVEDKR
ncbi:ROK family protein [Aliikangiella sp. G2MR2-5]|uniref:ROK family protein n=1 Tax=Aliikangiella sp. G2MR2-5 TaxID=2788943 RepID=UPI0018AC78C4|nr:ROK family protein [Aliikangiella sp. G2MR2-5]